jgi:hypothetical protein
MRASLDLLGEVNYLAIDGAGVGGAMRKRSRFVAATLVGAGLGAIGGSYIGSAAVWSGALVALTGLGLYLLTAGPDVRDGLAREPQDDRPPLEDLGTNVAEILRLAEEQAEDYRNDAQRQAQEILSAARLEARAILDRARTDAAE